MQKRTVLRGAMVSVGTGVLAVMVAGSGCGGGLPGGKGLPGKADCPDMADVEAVAKFDWSAKYKLDAAAGAQLKNSVEAAARLKALHADIDAKLKAACGDLAADLGSTTEAKSGEEACKAAVKAIGAAKAKLGADAEMEVKVVPPACGAPLEALEDCAAKCAGSVEGGSVKAECEGGRVSGECSAECSGSCELEAAAKCEGTCSGKCDAKVKGSCYGKCEGKCDGKATPKGGGAECDGTCDGKCDAEVDGECSGKCEGSCELKAQAKCEGTCSGECSAEVDAPKCDGEVKMPEVKADCSAKCHAEVVAELQCKPPRVLVQVSGAADAKYAATVESALNRNLPVIVEVAVNLGKQAPQLAASVKSVAEGGIKVAQELKGKASGDMEGSALAGQLVACVAAPFKGAIDAAAGFKANVNASVEVKASAEGSASAGSE